MAEEKQEQILTPEQVAAELQVTVITIYRRLRDGRIPGIRVGNKWRVRRTDFDAAIKKSMKTGKQL